MKNNSRENLMYRYLLGDLSEEEKIRFENECFADGERFEQMWTIENELVDDYVRGKLVGPDCERFERHYLTTPDRFERVAFARAFIKTADEFDAGEQREVRGSEDSIWVRLLAFLHWPNLVPVGALAAAALMLILGGLWLFNERAQLNRQLSQLRGENAADRQLADEQARELQMQIAAERERNDQLRAEMEKLREEQRAAAEKPAQPAVFSLLLSSALVRGPGDPQRLSLPKGVSLISLKMNPDDGHYRIYQVKLRTVEGQEVWTRQSVNARKGKGGAVVAITVPAAQLPRGDYLLTLFGVNERGEAEEVDKYFFRVTGK